MNLLKAEKLIELNHVKNVIDGISHVTNIPTTEFSIMGGHARRLYMLHHQVDMKPEDVESWSLSDIDIFCDIKYVLGDDMINFISRISLDMNDIPDYKSIPAEVFDEINLFLLEDRDYADKQCKIAIRKYLNNDSNKLVKLVDKIVKSKIIECLEGISSLFTESDDNSVWYAKEEPCFDSVTIDKEATLDTGNLLLNVKAENIIKMTECAISEVAYDDPAFKVSAKHLSFSVPLGNRIQLVFGNHSNIEAIDEFDIPQSKFMLNYPFNMEDVTYAGSEGLNCDTFYHVERMAMRNISPFRLMDRLQKYSNYGFTFSPTVLDEFHQHIDEFIGGNPIQSAVTYTSSLY